VQLPVGSPAAATGAPEGVRASKAGVVASALAVPAAGAGASGPGPAVVASADSLALVSVLAARASLASLSSRVGVPGYQDRPRQVRCCSARSSWIRGSSRQTSSPVVASTAITDWWGVHRNRSEEH